MVIDWLPIAFSFKYWFSFQEDFNYEARKIFETKMYE